MVIAPVYAPADSPALFTETARDVSPVPLPGLTDSHAVGVLSAFAVQFSAPPPLLDITIVLFEGSVPATELKLRLDEESWIEGGTAPASTSAHDRSALGKPPGEAPTKIASRGLLRVCITLPSAAHDVPSLE